MSRFISVPRIHNLPIKASCHNITQINLISSTSILYSNHRVQSRNYCPAPRKASAFPKRAFKVAKKKELFVDLATFPNGRRSTLKEYNRTLANSTLWMSQAAMILQKTPQYQNEATKVIAMYDRIQEQLEALKNGEASKFVFLYPAAARLPALTFGWPIIKYAIRQRQMEQLMSQYYKNGELFNAMVAKNRSTFTL